MPRTGLGGEKGIFSIGQDHPPLQDELGTTISKTKPLHDPVYLHSLSGNCPDPFFKNHELIWMISLLIKVRKSQFSSGLNK